MKELAEFVASLFNDLKITHRWFAVILILAAVVLGVVWYEHLTGYFYFRRLERKIALIQGLQNIQSQGVNNLPELHPLYESAVNDLGKYETCRTILPWMSVGVSASEWGKAISGALVWFLLAAVVIFSDIKRRQTVGTTIQVVIILALIGILFAWIGSVIPTVINPWVNYIGFPLLQGIVLLCGVLLYARQKAVAEAGRLRAESEKLKAETERIRAEIERLQAESRKSK